MSLTYFFFQNLVPTTHQSELILPASVNIADIHKRFPNINLNPVVLLEDILKKTDTTRPSNQKVDPPAQTIDLETKIQENVPEGHDNDVCAVGDKIFDNTSATKINGEKTTFLVEAHDDKEFVCLIDGCKAQFNFRTALQMHLIREHKSYKSLQMILKQHRRLKALAPNQNTNDSLQCDLCGETFLWKTFKDRHMKRFHSVSMKFICEICKKEYSTPNFLEKHIQQIHNPNAKKHK